MRRIVVLIALAVSACREAPDRFVGPDPFDSLSTAEAGRLTWNVFEDHSPVWNGTSDSIYYAARSYPGFPNVGGLLLSVPRTAGRAQLILEAVQQAVSPQPWLAAPALSPNRQSIAFVQLTEVYDPTIICNAGIACRVPALGAPDTSAANTLLVRGLLRVRPLSGTGQETTIPIVFEGLRDSARIAHPFQRQFERDRAEVFRPSWSPDGTRVVYSDGLRLHILTIASGADVVIPNTDDGVWPAWSPAGDVIAFTKLLRQGSHTVLCDCYRQGRVLPVAEVHRTIYHDGNRRTGRLMTIRPDGTDARDLGEGEAPAWTPNGQSILFQRAQNLWRSNPDGTGASMIPSTAFAYEPAISPDGRWLAYSRDQSSGDRLSNSHKPFDLWTVSF